MIKTYMISDYNAARFLNTVNDFIKDKKVIDIKFTSLITMTSDIGAAVVDRVLIIYEEEDNE